MPSQFGGDQCSKDYAPHMWVGDHFVGGTSKYIEIGGWEYHAGHTADETLVVERCRITGRLTTIQKWRMVSDKQIPDEVRNAFSPTANANRVQEVERLEKLFNPGS